MNGPDRTDGGQPVVSSTALAEIAGAFAVRRVRYLVVGGLAVLAHGYVRLTKDIDLVVDFSGDNAAKAVAALRGLGYVPRVPVAFEQFLDAGSRELWQQTKDMIVFTVWKEHHGYISEVDLFLSSPFDFAQAYATAHWSAMDREGRIPVSFVDLPTLLAMKGQANRERDRLDIAKLESIRDQRGEHAW